MTTLNPSGGGTGCQFAHLIGSGIGVLQVEAPADPFGIEPERAAIVERGPADRAPYEGLAAVVHGDRPESVDARHVAGFEMQPSNGPHP